MPIEAPVARQEPMASSISPRPSTGIAVSRDRPAMDDASGGDEIGKSTLEREVAHVRGTALGLLGLVDEPSRPHRRSAGECA